MNELAIWQCHKRVRAGKIQRIDAVYKNDQHPGLFRVHVRPADEGAGLVIREVPYGVFARLIAETGTVNEAIGQMLIVYDDGFVSWSPKETFSRGYALLGEEDAGGAYIGRENGEARHVEDDGA